MMTRGNLPFHCIVALLLGVLPGIAESALADHPYKSRVDAAREIAADGNGVYSIRIQTTAKESPRLRRAEQERILGLLRHAGAEIEVLARAVLIDSRLRVHADRDPAWLLSNETGVSVYPEPGIDPHARGMRNPGVTISSAGAANAKADADDAVTVAVFGTGVDYTHVALGGSGKPEDYAAAMENAGWAWEGFPTAVVTGGRDFQSDWLGGEDHNPVEAGFGPAGYPLGEGTAMASIVRRLAPQAEITAIKLANVRGTPSSSVAGKVWENGLLYAMEYAADPNLDGDPADHADIVVLPSHYVYEFYRAYDIPNSSFVGFYAAQALRLQTLATLGVLVITDIGRQPNLGKYGLVAAAAAPDAIAVGYVVQGENSGGPVLAAESTQGPVVRSESIKPDLVAWMTDDAVAAPGTGFKLAEMRAPEVAIAKVAGHAARLMRARPDLSVLEIKNLLVQTADRNVVRKADASDAPFAEPTAVGAGLINIDRALEAAVIAWDQETQQPSLSFGVQEVAGRMTVSKTLRVRNLSDAEQLLNLAVEYRDEEDAQGLEWSLPESVQLAPGESRAIDVQLAIDAAALGVWPITNREDYTPKNWRHAERDGYLVVRDGAGMELLNIPWMAKPRPASRFIKHFETLVEHNFDPTPFGEGFAYHGANVEYTIELTNESATPTLYAVLPMIYREPFMQDDRAAVTVGQLQATGGGIYPDDRCAGGRKLVLGARLWHPLALGFGVKWETFSEDFVTERGMREGVEAWQFINIPDAARGFNVTAILDESGQPMTRFMNLNVDKDSPQRYRTAELPTYMTPNGRNLLAQVCLDRLYHHGFATEQDFDHDFGWIFDGGLWNYPEVHTPIVEHNLALGGVITEVDGFSGKFTGVKGARVGLRLPMPGATDSYDVPAEAYSPLLEVGPNERFVVHAVREYVCNECGEVLLMSLSDSNGLWSPVHYGDSDGEVLPVIVANQSFTVAENAAAGTVLGQVRMDTPGLFAANFENFHNAGIRLMNNISGQPFMVSRHGEISIVNPGALDFEARAEYRLKLRMTGNNQFGGPAWVTIRLNNENDNAPVQTGDLPALQVANGDPVEFDVSPYFIDADGDPLSYTAKDLPAGLKLDASSGLLEGDASALSDDIRLVVSDGAHEVEAAVPVAKADTAGGGNTSGGGATGGFGVFLLALAAACRRRGRARQGAAAFCIVLAAGFAAMPAARATADDDSGASTPVADSPAGKFVQDEAGRTLYFVELPAPPLAAHAARNRTGFMTTANGGAARLDTRSVASRRYVQALAEQQDKLVATASAALGREPEPVNRYDTVLNGVTLYLTAAEHERLAALPDVRRITPVRLNALQTDSGPAFVRAPSLWNGAVGGLAATQGEGIVVGIIDSGITPLHPAFADIGGDGHDHDNPRAEVFGDCKLVEFAHLCNDKLIGIVSYPEITDRFVEDGLPRVGVDRGGHGTHVASTVAGNVLKEVPVFEPVTGEEAAYRFPVISGVAPHANIISYQVCDERGCFGNLTVEALEHAIDAGVNVVNYSVSGAPSDPWSNPHSLAFLNARLAGIHVASSAGNAGPRPSTGGSPNNAPWITAVAAATHDRGYSDAVLDNFTGGVSPLPEPMTGKAATSGYTGPVVYAGDYGNPFCVDFNADDVFSGEIVVCDRGAGIDRVQKGVNVRDAGGGGMILVNQPVLPPDAPAHLGELQEDFHLLPAVHLDAEDGEILKAWLEKGTGHTASINATVPEPDTAAADIVAFFSSRGPVLPEMDFLFPHIAAPGVQVYAAFTDGEQMDGGEQPYAFLDGTSMSSPHVAGGMALLAAQHPDWSPAELQSALMMTAQPDMRAEFLDEDDNSIVTGPAGPFDQGAGSMRLDRATRAGLVMDVAEGSYLAANPAEGGEPATLNAPALIGRGCVVDCRFTRRFRAVADGSYTVKLLTEEEDFSVVAEPSSFIVTAGDVRTVEFNAIYTGTRENEDLFGMVVLDAANDDRPDLHLPVVVRYVAGHAPETIEFVTGRDADVLRIPEVVTLGTDSLQSAFAGFAVWQKHPASIPGDATPQSLHDEDYIGPFQHVVLTVPPGTRVLAARLRDAESPDLDLYIYRDRHLDGRPTAGAELPACRSTGPVSIESCKLVNPEPGQYVVTVHNFGGPPDTQQHHITETVIVGDDAFELSVLDPGVLAPGVPTPLTAYFDRPLQEGTEATGLLSLGTRPDAPENIGNVIVNIRRGPDDVRITAVDAVPLAGQKATLTLEIAANASGMPRTLLVELPIPDDLTATSASHDGTIADGKVSWRIDRPVDAPAETLAVVIDTTGVDGYREFPLVATHVAETPFIPTPKESTEPFAFIVETLPVARINGKAEYTGEHAGGSQLTLSAADSSGSRPDETLIYTWQQTAGPDVVMADPKAPEITVTLPESGELGFALQVGNEKYESAPATATINIVPAGGPSNDGGSGGGALLWLLALPALWPTRVRRRGGN